MAPADDDLLTRELRRLPTPRAPRSLLPRVMAAVEGRASRPWYARGWSSWPAVWQAVSAAVVVVAVAAGGLWFSSGGLGFTAGDFGPRVGPVLGRAARFAHDAGALGAAVQTIWRAVIGPVAGYATALVLLMCAWCVTAGVALNRVALRGVSR